MNKPPDKIDAEQVLKSRLAISERVQEQIDEHGSYIVYSALLFVLADFVAGVSEQKEGVLENLSDTIDYLSGKPKGEPDRGLN